MYSDLPINNWMMSISNECNIMLKKYNIDLSKVYYCYETSPIIDNKVNNTNNMYMLNQHNIGGGHILKEIVDNSKLGILLYTPDIRLQTQPFNTVRYINL